MTKNTSIFSLFIITIFIPSFLLAQSPLVFWDDEQIDDFKKGIVNVEAKSSIAFASETVGAWRATAFLVDKNRGIFVTNAHVSSKGPVHINLMFHDGSFAPAQVLYYDAIHDFAFLHLDPDQIPESARELSLGSSFDLKEQDPVLLIGNNEAYEYSIKNGMVVNLTLSEGARHSATLQTSFDRTGGSSGSPVFNQKGEVIGLHFSGTDTTSFELRIEYIKDVVESYQKNAHLQRGDIGVQILLSKLSRLAYYLKVPEDMIKKLKAPFPNLRHGLVVYTTIPTLLPPNTLQPGDLILSIDNQPVGENIYLFDKLIDQKVNTPISIEIIRGDQLLSFQLPVHDLEKNKVLRFVILGGGTFHEITYEFRRNFGYEGDGIILCRGAQGTTLGQIGSSISNTDSAAVAIIVCSVNGQKIHNLDDLILVAQKFKEKEEGITLTYKDLNRHLRSERISYLDLDLKFSPVRLFQWNTEQLEWEEEVELGK